MSEASLLRIRHLRGVYSAAAAWGQNKKSLFKKVFRSILFSPARCLAVKSEPVVAFWCKKSLLQ